MKRIQDFTMTKNDKSCFEFKWNGFKKDYHKRFTYVSIGFFTIACVWYKKEK